MDLILQPFANAGTLTTPPQTDPNGFVNFNTGYTSDYEISLASGNTQAKAVERAVQNYLFNLLTGAAQAWQQAALPPWFAAMTGGYAKHAMVLRSVSGVMLPFRSLAAGNITDPASSSTWEYIQSSSEMISNIPMPTGGASGPTAALISAATDFNTVTTGTYETINDSVAASCSNAPVPSGGSVAAGVLEVISWVNGSTTYIIQRYVDRNNYVFTRSASAGSWTSWSQKLDLVVGDARYAKLAGLSTQTFNVATATAANNAVPLSQAQAMRTGYPSVKAYVGDQALSSSNLGCPAYYYGAGGNTFTLPDLTQGLTSGQTIPTIINGGTGNLTVKGFVPSGGVFQPMNTSGQSLSSITLVPGDWIQATVSDSQVYWVLTGSSTLKFHPVAVGSLNSTGTVFGINSKNDLLNGSGELGFIGWPTQTGGTTFVVGSDANGTYFTTGASSASGQYRDLRSAVFSYPAGVPLTVQGLIDTTSVTGDNCWFEVYCLNSSGVQLGSTLVSNFVAAGASATLATATLATTPTGTVSVYVNCVIGSGATVPAAGPKFRSIKISGNLLPSLYSQEATVAYLGTQSQKVTQLLKAQSIAGTSTYVVPSGIFSVFYRVWGAGAGGGGGATNAQSGNGGGAGGYSEGWLSVTPGQTLTLVAGSKGTGGANSGIGGTAGGTSSLTNGTKTVTCTGGAAGAGGGTGGGGSGVGSGGDFNAAGGSGTGPSIVNAAGSLYYGPPGGGAYGVGPTTAGYGTGDGTIGNTPGCGGSGGAGGSAGAHAGGNGGDGAVLVWG